MPDNKPPQGQKERPILFSGPMVRAILDGSKTQTRRIVKPQPPTGHRSPVFYPGHGWRWTRDRDNAAWPGPNKRHAVNWLACPYGVAGDRIWVITIKPLENPRYGAGDDGHIYRIDKPIPTKMRSASNGKGYQTITLCENGKRKTALVHLLVCEAFYGPKPAIYDEVRHLDGDKSNNNPDNLDWGTRQQNWSDRRFKGRGVRSKHWAAKITEEQAAEIRNSVYSQRVSAKKYGLSQSTVGPIKQGNIWNPTPAQSEPPNAARWASRITLEITGVRVERLQEISEADAKAEGVESKFSHDDPLHPGDGAIYWRNYTPSSQQMLSSARDSYHTLWDSINGKGAWERNPWVWVLNFNVTRGERVSSGARNATPVYQNNPKEMI